MDLMEVDEMKNGLRLLSIGFISVALTSCTALANKPIQQQTLANGNPISVAYVTPQPEWNCQQVSVKSYRWESSVDLFDQKAQELKRNAINYANEAHIDANYIDLQMPKKMSFSNPHVVMLLTGTAIYYQCLALPQDAVLIHK